MSDARSGPAQAFSTPLDSADSRSLVIRWGVVLLLVAISVLPFLRGVSAFFTADDLLLVPPLARVGGSVADFAWNAITRLEQVPTTFYRPLPFVTLRWEARAFGLRPEPFHLTNVALHAGATVLLFLIALRLLEPAAGPGGSRRRVPAALLAAAAFALFPRRVEPVLWISARPDMLASFLILLATFLLIHSARRARRTAMVWLTLSIAALWGAFLSKESVFLIPLALVVTGAATGAARADSAPAGADASARPRWLRAAPLLLLLSMAAYPIVRGVALGGRIGGYSADAYGAGWQMLTHPAKYAAYSVMPPFDLLPALAQSSWASRVGALGMLVIVLALLAIIIRQRTCVCARLGAAWLVASCVPVIAFTPSLSTTFNDRFLYLPGIGLALLVASALSRVTRRAVWTGVTALVAIYAALTIVVVERWRQAGALTEVIGRQLAARLNATPGDAPIFLAALPDSLAGAYVLRNGVRELAALAGGPRPERLIVLTYEFMEGPPRAPRSTVAARRGAADALIVESTNGYPAVRLADAPDPARLVQGAPPLDSLQRRQRVEFALPAAATATGAAASTTMPPTPTPTMTTVALSAAAGATVWIIGAAGVLDVP